MILRDLIYFDLSKAASIFSQLEDGLLKEIQASKETGEEVKDNLKFNLIDLFSAGFSKSDSKKISQMENKVLHHDLLKRIEAKLEKLGVLCDLNEEFNNGKSINDAEEKLRLMPYVRAEGWSVFEDYDRMKKIAEKINEINIFIKRCQMGDLTNHPEFRSVLDQINSCKAQILLEKDRNKKAKAEKLLESITEKMNNELYSALGGEVLDPDFISGLTNFINTFLPERINFRVYPVEDYPGLHFISNLKKDCFVDSDIENVNFTYGMFPNVKLTIFGLITSIPTESGSRFDPLDEFLFKDQEDKTQYEVFEEAFRGVFKGFEGMERFVRYSRYPNITVSPIAVYRTIRIPSIE